MEINKDYKIEKIRLANRETGPISIRIIDEELLQKLKKIIISHWSNENDERDFFPAPQPVSLERRDLQKLIDYEYLVCAKSDGMRFILICYGGNSYMVDRAFKFYKVNLSFKNNELYKCNEPYDNKLGAIFDGELVLNKQNKWQYVIHDCINIKGENISKNIFPLRYSEITKFINNYCMQENNEFKITSKQFFPFRQLNLLNKLMTENKLDHEIDGIIFTPKYKKVGSYTQYDLFKWKPRHLHTFDFKINKDEKGISAYVNKNGMHILYAFAPATSIEELLFIEELNKNCPDFVNNSIVECDYNDIKGTYTPIKLRSDKTYPNSYYTVKKTLSNIKENITIEELIDLSNKIGPINGNFV